LSERARSPVADDIARGDARLGEVFSFVSGLYFRGKLTYARAFAGGVEGIHVITPSRGLQSPEQPVSLADLKEFAATDVDPADARFRRPLERDARRLRSRVTKDTEIVLLGSIATSKYIDALGAIFGTRLRFPIAFVGRGDMSRGALLLRAAQEGRELEYAAVLDTARHGRRAPRIADM
jgi:hypothetical protein